MRYQQDVPPCAEKKMRRLTTTLLSFVIVFISLQSISTTRHKGGVEPPGTAIDPLAKHHYYYCLVHEAFGLLRIGGPVGGAIISLVASLLPIFVSVCISNPNGGRLDRERRAKGGTKGRIAAASCVALACSLAAPTN